MTRAVLQAAVLTGAFCAAFAILIDRATGMLAAGQVAGISFLSGFLGSIFAQTVLSRWKEPRK